VAWWPESGATISTLRPRAGPVLKCTRLQNGFASAISISASMSQAGFS
jgi:hypothetical protein